MATVPGHTACRTFLESLRWAGLPAAQRCSLVRGWHPGASLTLSIQSTGQNEHCSVLRPPTAKRHHPPFPGHPANKEQAAARPVNCRRCGAPQETCWPRGQQTAPQGNSLGARFPDCSVELNHQIRE